MDKDRWKTVNQIFHAALEVPANERPSFVRTASNGDPNLQAEVEQLLKADEDAGSYLEAPLGLEGSHSNFPSPVQQGDVLCGRFRILRAVGEGGMGHVFEALDSELAVHVALKIIRPEIASNPEALARFRQEARLARRITHPNVCRTFDIEREIRVVDPGRGTKQEVVFLTMEFLEGETLASRINREGPLPLNEAHHVACQIGDALRAAHTLGIVHRDMKPANIMLVPTESKAPFGFRAAITDFGLARIDSVVSPYDLTAISQTARPIGTLAYMAPEQLDGKAVSAATDIYAFGLILFEMVTGTRAFPSENLLSGIAKRLNGPPPTPRYLVPSLSAPWCRAVEGCLRLKPVDRFRSAADVIGVLDGSSVSLPRIGKPALVRRLPLASWPFRRRISALAAGSLAVVALFLGISRLYKLKPDSKVDPGALIYLAPVKNDTGEKALDNLNGLIQAGLTQSVQVNLLDQSRVGDTLQQMTKAPDTPITEPIAREIALRTDAVRVVFATITGSAGRYSLDIDIQEPDATSPLRNRGDWSRSFPWQTTGQASSSATISPKLLTTIRNASDWIRLEVGESANDIVRLDLPPEDVTTANWEALADYSYAEMLAAQQKRTQAVSALQSAVQKDPDFALAYARLGDILVNLNHVDEGYRAYLKALRDSEQTRLSLRERDRIKGIYAQDTGDFQSSEDAFREYCLYYEHDYLGWFYRARPLSMLGRTREAIDVLKQAHQIDPHRVSALISLVGQNLLSEDTRAARQWAEELKKDGNEDAYRHADGLIDFAEHRYEAANKAFQALAQSPIPLYRSQGIRFSADLASEQGNYPVASAQLTRAIDDDPDDSTRLLDRAYVNGAIGGFARCADDMEKAIDKDKSPFTLLMASEILGQTIPKATGASAVRLRAILNSLERELPSGNFGTVSEIARLRVRGEILLSNGNSSEALAEFRKSDKLEAPLSSRDYLGRALEAQAATVHDSAGATRLREQAMSAYAQIASHPAVVWQFPIAFPPGFYRQQLEQWVRLAKTLGKKKEQMQPLLDELAKLRPFTDLTHAGRP